MTPQEQHGDVKFFFYLSAVFVHGLGLDYVDWKMSECKSIKVVSSKWVNHPFKVKGPLVAHSLMQSNSQIFVC